MICTLPAHAEGAHPPPGTHPTPRPPSIHAVASPTPYVIFRPVRLREVRGARFSPPALEILCNGGSSLRLSFTACDRIDVTTLHIAQIEELRLHAPRTGARPHAKLIVD